MVTYAFKRNADNDLEIWLQDSLVVTIKDPEPEFYLLPGTNIFEISYSGMKKPLRISTADAQFQLPGEDTPTLLSAQAIRNLSLLQVQDILLTTVFHRYLNSHTVSTFSRMKQLATGNRSQIFLVVSDETNADQPTAYLYHNSKLFWLPSLQID